MALNFTANGDTTVPMPKGAPFIVQVRYASGTGTIAIQTDDDGTRTNFTTIASGDGGTFTADGERGFYNTGDSDTINVNLSSASSADINVTVHPVPHSQ